jgi:hypothetical protein
LNAALARQTAINKQIVEQQTTRVESAQKALDDATNELLALKKTSGGQFEAQQRLARHRQQHPNGFTQ